MNWEYNKLENRFENVKDSEFNEINIMINKLNEKKIPCLKEIGKIKKEMKNNN
jgi:hypothetical protein